MKTYRLFFVSVYRFIWNTFLYDISSILLIIIFKLPTPLSVNVQKSLVPNRHANHGTRLLR